MKNHIVSVTRYLRATPYGWILVFTAFYSSGHSRKWVLRNSPSGRWSETIDHNCSLVSDLQRSDLPATVLQFIDRCENEGLDFITLFRPSPLTSVVMWHWEG